MKSILIENNEYEVVRDDNCIDKNDIDNRYTDYFKVFDYICGDYSYDKLRLKGFYESTNKKTKKINDIKYVDDYIKDYCSYGAKIFIIKKLK